MNKLLAHGCRDLRLAKSFKTNLEGGNDCENRNFEISSFKKISFCFQNLDIKTEFWLSEVRREIDPFNWVNQS